MPKVSIIVPVYNAEIYLRKCLDSILGQTLADIEIIVVNDESPDNSLEIIRQYEARDKRIRVVNRKQNGGLARARNSGLRIAGGDYIGFVDCDDWIEPDMFEKMYDAGLKTDADIVICDYNRIFENHVEKSRLGVRTEILDMDGLGIKQYFERYQATYNHGDEVWNKIYKRKYLQDYQIWFDTETFSEDKLFNLSCLLNVKRICTIHAAFYNYLQREGSLMYREKPEYTKMQMILMEKFYSKIQKHHKHDFNALFNELVLQVIENVVFGKFVFDKKSVAAVLNDLKDAQAFYFFKPSMRRLMTASQSAKQKVYAFLLYHDLYLPFLLLKKFFIKTKYSALPELNKFSSQRSN